MILRRYRPSDDEAVARLFHDTVHTVSAKDYTPAQLAAWAPDALDAAAWCRPLAQDYTLVAQALPQADAPAAPGAIPPPPGPAQPAPAAPTLLGFASLTDTGYLDRLYVHKNHQRKGIATRLVDALEAHARAQGIPEIRTDASITARPFYLARGYRQLRENTVRRGGQSLINYTMLKTL